MNKEIMIKAGFQKEMDAIGKGECPFCGKEIDFETEFRDYLSRKEYKISGLCQACQDGAFGK